MLVVCIVFDIGIPSVDCASSVLASINQRNR